MTTDPNLQGPHAQPGSDPALQEEASASAEHTDLAAVEENSVEQLTTERDDMRDRWLRAEAEIANVRARAKRDVDDTRQYAVQKFATDVVEAAENLRRGLASLPAAAPDEPESVAKLREGLEGIERHFIGILERNGIHRIDPTGQPYDPNLHQSMAEQPSTEHAPGTVLQAWTQAWTLHGRLLKPAMVVVAKRADQEAVA